MRRTMGSMLAGVLVLAGMALANPAAATGWLGVYSQDITPELRDGMNYNGAGALVTRVVPDSPADHGGIERGDVIVQVGSRDVASPEELIDAVGSSAAGSLIDVLVVRDGAKKSLRVTLASRPDSGDSEDDSPMPRMHMRTPDAPEAPEAPDAPPAPRTHMMQRHMLDGGDADELMSQLPQMLGGGMIGRGRLGVRIESLNPDLASYFGSRDAKGALVLDVTDGSPADKAGIRAGDVITRLDGKTIEDADDLIGAVRSGEGTVSISLLRHGAKQTVETELGKAPKLMRFQNGPQGMNWQRRNGNTWEWNGPDGSGTKRIIIRSNRSGDEDAPDSVGPEHLDLEGDGGPMLHRGNAADREGMDSLREEVQQLREQLEQLRKELKSNR